MVAADRKSPADRDPVGKVLAGRVQAIRNRIGLEEVSLGIAVREGLPGQHRSVQGLGSWVEGHLALSTGM